MGSLMGRGNQYSMGSLQVEETSAYCTVNHRASVSNYHLSNMKCPARDSNRRPQRLEVRTLTAIPPNPLLYCKVPTNGKQLPAFPLEVGPGFKL